MDGSNCQRFAYGVLELFGLTAPVVRSSELWQDNALTERVVDPRPLDLLLFNDSPDPWGAHVGIWMAHDEILHLCQEIGFPVTWKFEEFVNRERYSVLIGVKRVLSVATEGKL